jgi:hypothetical protein
VPDENDASPIDDAVTENVLLVTLNVVEPVVAVVTESINLHGL